MLPESATEVNVLRLGRGASKVAFMGDTFTAARVERNPGATLFINPVAPMPPSTNLFRLREAPPGMERAGEGAGGMAVAPWAAAWARFHPESPEDAAFVTYAKGGLRALDPATELSGDVASG